MVCLCVRAAWYHGIAIFVLNTSYSKAIRYYHLLQFYFCDYSIRVFRSFAIILDLLAFATNCSWLLENQCLFAMAAINKALHEDEIRSHFYYARNLLKAFLITYMKVLHKCYNNGMILY